MQAEKLGMAPAELGTINMPEDVVSNQRRWVFPVPQRGDLHTTAGE